MLPARLRYSAMGMQFRHRGLCLDALLHTNVFASTSTPAAPRATLANMPESALTAAMAMADVAATVDASCSATATAEAASSIHTAVARLSAPAPATFTLCSTAALLVPGQRHQRARARATSLLQQWLRAERQPRHRSGHLRAAVCAAQGARRVVRQCAALRLEQFGRRGRCRRRGDVRPRPRSPHLQPTQRWQRVRQQR